jgi:hypothetical protein
MSKKKSEPAKCQATAFDYTLDFKRIDFRKQPELYRVGKGEQGVLLVEPYKSVSTNARWLIIELMRQGLLPCYDHLLKWHMASVYR